MANKIIDLTHRINEDITVYPGTPKPRLEVSNTIEKHGFAELRISMCTHTGTHMDAPSHMIEHAKSLDRFPMSKFMGKAMVIKCKDKETIELEFLRTMQEQISQCKFLLFYTGWQEKWHDPGYFENFPVLTKETAKWLCGFNLEGLGFDSISVDKVTDLEQPNHHILLDKEILIIENLTNLDNLPQDFFQFHSIPLKIENADGSPVRAYAIK